MQCFVKIYFLRAAILISLLAGALAARAQDPVPPPVDQPSDNSQQPADDQTKKENAPGNTESTQEEPPAESPHAPVMPASALFRLGGGGMLSNDQSPVRLGPLSLVSADVLGAYNRFSSADGTTVFAQTGSLMRADVVLAEQLKNLTFMAQWEPRLTIFDGHAIGDVDNGSVDFSTHYDFTRRLTLSLNDRFSYFASRLLYGDFFLSSGEVQNPVTQQNSFLDTPGHSLNNNLFATLNYQISPLTQVSVSPSFYYSRPSTESTDLFSNRSQVYSGQVTLTHTVSPRTNFGFSYGISAVKMRDSDSTPLYHSLTANYGRLLSRTLSFTGSAGVSTTAVPNVARIYSFTGNASLTKTLEKTSLAINYSRGLYLDDYLTTAFTDRVDGEVTHVLGQRYSVGGGVGYQRESRTDGFEGTYASGFMTVRILPMISAYGRYTYTNQKGDIQLLETGTRNLVVFGLRFQAPTAKAK